LINYVNYLIWSRYFVSWRV